MTSKIEIIKKTVNADKTMVTVDYSIDGQKQTIDIVVNDRLLTGYIYSNHLTSLIRVLRVLKPDTMQSHIDALKTIAREKGKTAPNHSKVMYSIWTDGLNLAYLEYLQLVHGTGLTKTAFSNWRLNTGKAVTDKGLTHKSIHCSLHKYNIPATVDKSLHDALYDAIKRASGTQARIALIRDAQARTKALRAKPVIKSVKVKSKKSQGVRA